MKAIIELTSWKTSQARALRAAKKADAGKPVKADYHLDFDSMNSLFSDITPARMQVIESSKHLGPLSVYALAKAMGRNYSNVHRDVGKLLELELMRIPTEATEVNTRTAGQLIPLDKSTKQIAAVDG